MEEDIKRDIVNYRRQKACDLMHDVDVLIDNELWNSAVNRMYYACFHMVSALLILHGIEVKSHMGVRQAFGLHFVKTNLLSSECGRIFSKIYDKGSQVIMMISKSLPKMKLIICILRFHS